MTLVIHRLPITRADLEQAIALLAYHVEPFGPDADGLVRYSVTQANDGDDGEAMLARFRALRDTFPPDAFASTRPAPVDRPTLAVPGVRREPRAVEIVEDGEALAPFPHGQSAEETPADALPADVCRRCRLGIWAHEPYEGADGYFRCADGERGEFGEVRP